MCGRGSPSDGAEGDYTFDCPECEESVRVNAAMKRALLDDGCVICGAEVSPSAFTDAA